MVWSIDAEDPGMGIKVAPGTHTWISLKDAEIAWWGWTAQRSEAGLTYVWASDPETGHKVWLHRVIWEREHGPIPQGIVVDHVDRDPLNNRRSNLRLASPAQNLANQGLRRQTQPKSSQYRGVRRRGDSWTAQITVQGRQLYLGAFHTERAAARAYDAAAKRFYGSFANCNFEETNG